jgi:nitrate reductase NapE component
MEQKQFLGLRGNNIVLFPLLSLALVGLSIILLPPFGVLYIEKLVLLWVLSIMLSYLLSYGLSKRWLK